MFFCQCRVDAHFFLLTGFEVAVAVDEYEFNVRSEFQEVELIKTPAFGNCLVSISESGDTCKFSATMHLHNRVYACPQFISDLFM